MFWQYCHIKLETQNKQNSPEQFMVAINVPNIVWSLCMVTSPRYPSKTQLSFFNTSRINTMHRAPDLFSSQTIALRSQMALQSWHTVKVIVNAITPGIWYARNIIGTQQWIKEWMHADLIDYLNNYTLMKHCFWNTALLLGVGKKTVDRTAP